MDSLCVAGYLLFRLAPCYWLGIAGWSIGRWQVAVDGESTATFWVIKNDSYSSEHTGSDILAVASPTPTVTPPSTPASTPITTPDWTEVIATPLRPVRRF